MRDPQKDRLDTLYADLCEAARAEGEPAPSREEVAALAALLADVPHEAALPTGLVPSMQAALLSAVPPTQPCRAARPSPGLRALLGLLWAEARFLPLSFFALQAGLLALALLANRYLTGFAGPQVALAAEAGSAGLLARTLLHDALGHSVDALTLVAPWLGLAAALFAALPRRRGLWADLEALSPISGPTRLLARAAVATLIAATATSLAGLAQTGATPAALLLLARTAPLFLAVAWASAWAVPFGTAGAAAASLALWGGLSLYGGRLGRWDLFAPPGTALPAQALALAASVALTALAWALSRRLEPQTSSRAL